MMKSIPKSTEQTLIAFNELVRRDSVVDFIKKYREFLGIPKDGLELAEEDKMHLMGDSAEAVLASFLYIPKRKVPQTVLTAQLVMT